MPNNRRMGGGRGFSQPFQGGVSPWQGGMNQGGGGGLLSQLGSNPQQLALALTTLLSQPQQANPPSLLSLNTAAFSGPQGGGGRFVGNRGRDMRRHEPYNKNRQGGNWRQDNRGGNNNNRNRNQQNKNNQNNQNKKQQQQKSKDTPKADEKKNDNKNKKAKEPAADTIDLSMDEDDKESKRDWKDEKNQSAEGKDEGSDSKEGRFHGVPIKFLNCFVCNKEMWDGESMEKHLKGRAHKEMFKALEESIHITVNILRENMRLSEERKMIEMNRLHRLKKNFNMKFDFESNCNMCDLKFIGKITNHRKTEGHQRLKHYLHPTCKICTKEFPSRMEWIEHRLTPEHLRKVAEDLKGSLGGDEGAELILNEEEDLDIEPLLEEPLQLESDDPITELNETMEGIQNSMPSYKPDRAVATKNLIAFSGFLCDICNRSFNDESLAKAHLKTKRHYIEFVGKVKEIHLQNKEKEKKTQKEKEEKEKKEKELKKKEEEEEEENAKENEAEGEDQEMYDPEAVTNDEEGEGTEETEETEEAEENEDADTTIKAADVNGEGEKMDDEEVKEEAEEVKEEVKGEPEEEEEEPEEKKPPPPVKPSPVRRGVKNGAGPKSKKVAAAAIETKPVAPGYRIPKKTGPASKKK